MEGYNVMYHATDQTTDNPEGLPDTDVSLEEIQDICAASHINAALYAENGEYRGWVHADRNYCLY